MPSATPDLGPDFVVDAVAVSPEQIELGQGSFIDVPPSHSVSAGGLARPCLQKHNVRRPCHGVCVTPVKRGANAGS